MYSIYNLLFLFSKRRGGDAFVAFEESTEMALVLKTELIGYFLNGQIGAVYIFLVL